MCVRNTKSIDDRITKLEERIKDLVKIPDSLKPNLRFETTSLGGLFLEFSSEVGSNLAVMNSKHKITIYIVTSSNSGEYRGDIATLEVSHARAVKKPRQIKTLSSPETIAKAINKWIDANRADLESFIDN